MTVLDGDPGCGKSTLTYDLAARVTTARAMPFDPTPRVPAGVLLVQAEDDAASKVRPALHAAGADLDRVLVLASGARDRTPFTIPDGLEAVDQIARQNHVKLVVIDPLLAFLGANACSDQKVRKALAPLARLAERRELAVVLVRHLTKGRSSRALYRGSGSIEIIAAARSALLVGPDPDSAEPHRYVLTLSKSNSACAESLAYRTCRCAGALGIEWIGPSQRTAGDIAAADRPGGVSALDEAQYFVYSILEKGPVRSSELLRLARSEGIAPRTLVRARKALGVESRKRGGGRGSYTICRLPRDEQRLRPFRDRALDDLTDHLLHGDDEESTCLGFDPPHREGPYREEWEGTDDSTTDAE
jgi:hypothetical protein